jgi:hypothetical protein
MRSLASWRSAAAWMRRSSPPSSRFLPRASRRSRTWLSCSDACFSPRLASVRLRRSAWFSARRSRIICWSCSGSTACAGHIPRRGQQPEGGGGGDGMEDLAHGWRKRNGGRDDRGTAYFLPMPPCWRKMRVGANSPSLWPTMFSVTYTGNEGLAVVDGEVVADEVRGDHRLAAPGFDGLAVGTGFGDGVDLGEQLLIDEGPFLRERGMGNLRFQI